MSISISCDAWCVFESEDTPRKSSAHRKPIIGIPLMPPLTPSPLLLRHEILAVSRRELWQLHAALMISCKPLSCHDDCVINCCFIANKPEISIYLSNVSIVTRSLCSKPNDSYPQLAITMCINARQP